MKQSGDSEKTKTNKFMEPTEKTLKKGLYAVLTMAGIIILGLAYTLYDLVINMWEMPMTWFPLTILALAVFITPPFYMLMSYKDKKGESGDTNQKAE